MDERKLRILQAIIDDYVDTAAPVGSGTISRKYLSHLSSATIRNEMSDLEALGYLYQPHISAGRVPMAKAYRLYVDQLLAGFTPSPADEALHQRYLQKVSHLEDIAQSTAQALGELTRLAALVMMPRQDQMRVSTLQLVPVRPGLALLVIVTDGGIIRDTMVHVSPTLGSDGLYAISRLLSERFSGRTLQEVQTLLKEFANHLSLDPQVVQGLLELASQMEKQGQQDSIKVSGAHNLLGYPEYQEADRARKLLRMLGDHPRLLKLLDASSGSPLRIHIGQETGIPEMGECAVVVAEYQVGQGRRGAIALLGPTRLPYARLMGSLSLISQSMTRVLSGQQSSTTRRTT